MLTRYFVLLLAITAVMGCKSNAPAPLGAGERFPDLALEDLQGQKVIFPGTIKAAMSLVSIRTIGCRFCASDFLELERLYQTYNRDELAIVVINVGVEVSSVEDFLAGKDISFPVFIDQEMESMRQTRSVILPVAYLFNKDQTIVHRLTGGFSSDEIRSLLAPGRGRGAKVGAGSS